MVDLLAGLRYYTYAGDEIAIITTAPLSVTEITYTHKGMMPMPNKLLLGES